MTEIVFAFNVTSTSSDHYLGICRVPNGASIYGRLKDAILDAVGEEYAYLEQVDLYTDSKDHTDQIRFLLSELTKDFQRAYEVEVQ